MTAELKHEIRLKRYLWHRYKTSNFKNKDLNEQYKLKNKSVKGLVKSTIKAYEKKLAQDSKLNPKQIYTYINSKLKVKDNIKAIICDNNEISNDEQTIANQLNKFFSSVFTKENLNNIPECENFTDKKCPNPSFNEIDIESR
jgi:hypothetical protein